MTSYFSLVFFLRLFFFITKHTVFQDIADLRHDLARKEELIKRHYDKIAVWQNLLSDLQGWAKSPAHQGTGGAASGATPPISSGGPMSGPGMSGMGGEYSHFYFIKMVMIKLKTFN